MSDSSLELPATSTKQPRRNRWILSACVCFLIAFLGGGFWVLWRGTRQVVRSSYYVTWQAIVDKETLDKLNIGLKTISLQATAPTGFGSGGHSKNDTYTESFSGALSEELKKPHKTTLEGFRGSGEFLRKIVSECLNSKTPPALSNELRWNFDPIVLMSLRRQIDPMTRVMELFSRLFSRGRSFYNGILTWDSAQFNESDPSRSRFFSGHLNATFRIVPKSGTQEQLIVGGQLHLHASHHEHGENPVSAQTITGVSWFLWDEVLSDGDAIVLIARNPRLQGMGEAVISVCERVDLPVEFEPQSPSGRNVREWFKKGPQRLKQLMEQARVWAASAEKKLVARLSRTKPLSDGRSVTLLAVGRPQDFPLLWWTPEGKPISAELLSELAISPANAPGTAILLVSPAHQALKADRAVDLQGLGSNLQRSWQSNNNVTQMVITPAGRPGIDSEGRESFVSVPVWNLDSLKAAGIELNFGVGEWKSIGTVPATVNSEAFLQERKCKIQNMHEHTSGGSTSFFLFGSIRLHPDEDAKVTAVTKNGKRMEGNDLRDVYVPNPRQQTAEVSIAQQFKGVAAGDVDHFEISVRPLEKLHIGPVNFAPAGLPVEPDEAPH